jgi:hypothetical protein
MYKDKEIFDYLGSVFQEKKLSLAVKQRREETKDRVNVVLN